MPIQFTAYAKSRISFLLPHYSLNLFQNTPTSLHSNKICRTEIGGYFGAVWRGLEERLNFTTKYIVSPDNRYGGLTSDGKWNGLIGMAKRKQIDVIVAEMTMTQERIKVVDFLRPILITDLQIFFRPPGILTDWDVVLRPFGRKTWIAFIISFSVLALSLKIFYSLGVRYNLERKTWENEFQFMQSIFFVISAITQQGK